MMPVPETYDDSDFSSLSWHDCRLYRIDVPDEKSSFVLDIDYIFEWEKSGDSFLAVWASPCRLVFEGVNYLKVNLDFENSSLLYISEIERTNERTSPDGSIKLNDYKITLDKGVIEFTSTGFNQRHLRQPVRSENIDLGR